MKPIRLSLIILSMFCVVGGVFMLEDITDNPMVWIAGLGTGYVICMLHLAIDLWIELRKQRKEF